MCGKCEPKSQSYLVSWTVDIEADSPLDAARKARAMQLRRDSIATWFYVSDKTTAEYIDLEEYPL